ncbi:holo-ACP synthase [bacterium]|nr:holo-ACP synthase [bacterium]
MVRAVGLDIIETERITRAIDRFGERFVNRILGPRERDILGKRRDRAQFVAGRFAAKEAAIKAMADFFEKRPPYAHIQIVNEPGGKPVYSFHSDIAAHLTDIVCHVSISHDKNVVAAVAVFSDRS